VVQQALKEGKTLEQMKQANLLAPWKKYDGDFITEDAFLETLYNSLTGQKTGKFMKHKLKSHPVLFLRSLISPCA
jgi:hypothetical protein